MRACALYRVVIRAPRGLGRRGTRGMRACVYVLVCRYALNGFGEAAQCFRGITHRFRRVVRRWARAARGAAGRGVYVFPRARVSCRQLSRAVDNNSISRSRFSYVK